jgi:hypothetical protein
VGVVGVGVTVGVLVTVGVGVTVGVSVGVLVGVEVGVSVGVLVGVSVAVSVGVAVEVGVDVGVFVGVEVGVFVGVSVGVGVGVSVCCGTNTGGSSPDTCAPVMVTGLKKLAIHLKNLVNIPSSGAGTGYAVAVMLPAISTSVSTMAIMPIFFSFSTVISLFRFQITQFTV